MKDRELVQSENKVFGQLHLAYIILVIALTIYLMWENNGRRQEIVLLIMLFSFFVVLRHRLVLLSGVYKKMLPILEILITIPIALFSISAVSMWLILINNIDIIIDMDKSYSIPYSILSYLIYIFLYLMKLKPNSLVGGLFVILIAMIQYGIIMGVGYMAKDFYRQRNSYRNLVARQKAQMLELEQLAVLEERNRMAGEIHDSVGHRLTAALVQLEAGMMINESDSNNAIERFEISRDQVKQALEELRVSVRALHDSNYEAFEDKLMDLENRVVNTTGIQVKTEYKQLEDIPIQFREIIYFVIMEAITNAIKHGHCKVLKLDINWRRKSMRISNDGIAPQKIVKGFGYCRMEERLASIGSELTYGVNSDNHFYIEALFKESECDVDE